MASVENVLLAHFQGCKIDCSLNCQVGAVIKLFRALDIANISLNIGDFMSLVLVETGHHIFASENFRMARYFETNRCISDQQFFECGLGSAECFRWLGP